MTSHKDDKDIFDIVLTIVFLIFALAAICAAVMAPYLVYKSIHADGKVQYCYVEHFVPPNGFPYYKVAGHREWRADNSYGQFLLMEDALARAKQLNCEIK